MHSLEKTYSSFHLTQHPPLRKKNKTESNKSQDHGTLISMERRTFNTLGEVIKQEINIFAIFIAHIHKGCDRRTQKPFICIFHAIQTLVHVV